MKVDAPEKPGGPRSVLRVLEILETIATHPNGLTLTELAVNLSLPKTSVFSLLKALEMGDYVSNHDGRYMLGSQAISLGAALNQPHSFTQQIRPILERLSHETGETIMLAVCAEEGQEVAYIDVIESEAPLRFAVRPGNRRPFYCAASGKAILAFLPDDLQKDYLARTNFVRFTADTSDRKDLMCLLPEIRERGVVLDANGIIDGAAGIASPAFDRDGRVACSISIAGPTTRILAKRSELEAMTLQAGEEISRLLGYKGSYPPKWSA